MAEVKFDWEKDLAKPLSNAGSNKDWMQLVEMRVMRKKHAFRRTVPFAAGVVALLVVLGVLASNDNYLRQLIPVGNHVPQASDLSQVPLVEGHSVRILVEDFLWYKTGLHPATKLSDGQIINELIAQQLTAQYAQTLGLVAPPREIELAISNETDLLKTEDDPANASARKQLADHIKKMGMSENEYLESDLIKRIWEQRLLLSRLASTLLEDGTIDNGDDFDKLQKQLLLANKDKYTINWSVLPK